jgi:hypothetical protein
MVLEWLRRRDSYLDRQLRRYLFTEVEITAVEEDEMRQAAGCGDGSLGIGSLRSQEQQP